MNCIRARCKLKNRNKPPPGIPAQAGIQRVNQNVLFNNWIPACAGTTATRNGIIRSQQTEFHLE